MTPHSSVKSRKATLPLARRGYTMTCVELGPALASAARQNLAGFPEVEVIEGAFETFDPPATDPFDLVFAATAWHWLDPTIRYRRAWELLRSGGHLAIWSASHVFPQGGDPIFAELQKSTTRSEKAGRRMRRSPVRANCPTSARRSNAADCRDHRRAPLRLGDRLRHGGLPPTARHVLGAHRDAIVAAGPAALRDPTPARGADRWAPSSWLGRRSSCCSPTRRPARAVDRSSYGRLIGVRCGW